MESRLLCLWFFPCKPRTELVLRELFKLLGRTQFASVKNDAIPVMQSVLEGGAISGFLGQSLEDT